MGEVDRLTGEVAGIAGQSLREVQAVLRNARGALARRPGDGRLGRLVGDLEETIAATGRLLAQTDQRLAGNRVIPDRLVSLSDPDARPIRKGKPGRPTEFGCSLLVAEDERGFIADHQLQQGNPPDAPQLVAAVGRVIGVTGRAPATVVGDRGFGTAANDQAVAALGVKRVGLQRTGTPGKARLAVERTRAFRRLRNWRVGIEPASATSSAALGFGAPGCVGWGCRPDERILGLILVRLSQSPGSGGILAARDRPLDLVGQRSSRTTTGEHAAHGSCRTGACTTGGYPRIRSNH